jgi:tetratricopeptide (TPR) repeat protein
VHADAVYCCHYTFHFACLVSALTFGFHYAFPSRYSGLVSFWIGREINDKKRESMKWLARGVACKDEIEKLAASASKWNFQNSEYNSLHDHYLSWNGTSYLALSFCTSTEVYLLQAEEQFCRMNFEEAEKLYDAAILTSKTHKFLNEEALANELAGHFYLETGRRNRSVQYFSQAFEKYNEWGAAAKANMLTKYLDGR